MGFEQYVKQTGKKQVYNFPSVSFGRTHFTFNLIAITQFNFSHREKFLLYYDHDKQIIKFTKIPNKAYGCLSFIYTANKSFAQMSSLGFIKYFKLKTTKPAPVYHLESIGSNQYIINLNAPFCKDNSNQKL